MRDPVQGRQGLRPDRETPGRALSARPPDTNGVSEFFEEGAEAAFGFGGLAAVFHEAGHGLLGRVVGEGFVEGKWDIDFDQMAPLQRCMMTRGMARELGGDSIRVNAVAPSAVMTEGTEEFFGEKLEKAKKVIASGQVIRRNLQTQDLTGTIVYLASDNSAFVTGQTHMVDGGSWFL